MWDSTKSAENKGLLFGYSCADAGGAGGHWLCVLHCPVLIMQHFFAACGQQCEGSVTFVFRS